MEAREGYVLVTEEYKRKHPVVPDNALVSFGKQWVRSSNVGTKWGSRVPYCIPKPIAVSKPVKPKVNKVVESETQAPVGYTIVPEIYKVAFPIVPNGAKVWIYPFGWTPSYNIGKGWEYDAIYCIPNCEIIHEALINLVMNIPVAPESKTTKEAQKSTNTSLTVPYVKLESGRQFLWATKNKITQKITMIYGAGTTREQVRKNKASHETVVKLKFVEAE